MVESMPFMTPSNSKTCATAPVQDKKMRTWREVVWAGNPFFDFRAGAVSGREFQGTMART